MTYKIRIETPEGELIREHPLKSETGALHFMAGAIWCRDFTGKPNRSAAPIAASQYAERFHDDLFAAFSFTAGAAAVKKHEGAFIVVPESLMAAVRATGIDVDALKLRTGPPSDAA